MQCILTVNLNNDACHALVEKFLETCEDILNVVNTEIFEIPVERLRKTKRNFSVIPSR
jgi:hypothetical protein